MVTDDDEEEHIETSDEEDHNSSSPTPSTGIKSFSVQSNDAKN